MFVQHKKKNLIAVPDEVLFRYILKKGWFMNSWEGYFNIRS